MSVLMLVVSCVSSSEPALRLEGPSEVHVRALGPVDGPRVVTAAGEPPDGVIVTLSRDGVARVDGEHVVAVGAGEVTVGAEWEGSRVEWVLRVELDTQIELTFVSPPSTVPVGVPVRLQVAAAGGARVAPSTIGWSSSDARVLAVDGEGTAIGVTAGVAYVTARTGGASAMVEVEVVP